jgi:cobalt-zinc-cadmium efflux system membrane fusion protein
MRRVPKGVVAIAAAMAVVIAAVVFLPRVKQRLADARGQESSDAPAASPAVLVDGHPATLQLPSDVVRRFGIQTAKAESATQAMALELSGTLILDANRMSHVHARFPGEIVELGALDGSRPVDFGAGVQKGQLLAVIWSRDLGEKKSDLVDGLSQLWVDEETWNRMSAAAQEGAIPDRTLRQAERQVEADRIVVARVMRTLETWRVPQEEIDAVRAEAQRLAKEKGKGRAREEMVHQWARSEVRAPLAGVILERNAALGDLVDTTVDLFKIADLSRLRVVAHAYEEDLPALDALPASQRHWSVQVGADAKLLPRSGNFDQIGRIIDPNQHTALVMGWVDNADGRLRVGQFITATVGLTPPKNEVAVPATAIVEEGSREILFVQPEGSPTQFTRRQVALARRAGPIVFVRGQLTAEQRRRGLEPLSVGERVVTAGVVQLTDAMRDLKSTSAEVN